MESKLARFFELKQMQKEIEEELEVIRKAILQQYSEPVSLEIGDYRLKVTSQARREYDDNVLYNSLPDSSLWRLLSKTDTAKVASLLKLNVISEKILEGTYTIKYIPYVQVQKK